MFSTDQQNDKKFERNQVKQLMKLKKICEILKDREITENCFKRQDSDGISKDTILTPITPFIV